MCQFSLLKSRIGLSYSPVLFGGLLYSLWPSNNVQAFNSGHINFTESVDEQPSRIQHKKLMLVDVNDRGI